MKLLRTTALTAALMTAAIPLLTSDAQAWRGWRGAGWGWRGAALGAAAVGTALAARSYYGGYGYGYPAYGYGYGSGYSYPSYGYGYGTGYSYPAYTGYSYPHTAMAMARVTVTRLTAMAGALSAELSTAPLGVAVGKEPDKASRRVSAEERLLGRSKLGAAVHYEDRFHT